LKEKIKSIAVVETWIYARTWTEGDVTYLQANYYDNYGELREQLSPSLKREDINAKFILQDKDILFSAKWTRNFATVYRSDLWPCVASSTFLVIRIAEKDKILPEFIALVLNNFTSSPYFRKNTTTWVALSFISKKVLSEFEILITSVEKQKKLIDLNNLHKKQIGILNKLIESKEKLINNVILQYDK